MKLYIYVKITSKINKKDKLFLNITSMGKNIIVSIKIKDYILYL